MSNLSDVQFRVYRGLNVPSHKVDYTNLGEHWTLDPSVAKGFAGKGGTVVSGVISKEHTLPSEWSERKAEWKKNPEHFDKGDDYSGSDPEREVRLNAKKITDVRNWSEIGKN